MCFVPNCDNKEIILFGNYNAKPNFASSLQWFSLKYNINGSMHSDNKNESISIEKNDKKTKAFQMFEFIDNINNKLIANKNFYDFGYIIVNNYLIIFGGTCGSHFDFNDSDLIFYFDFNLMKWFQSHCVKYLIYN